MNLVASLVISLQYKCFWYICSYSNNRSDRVLLSTWIKYQPARCSDLPSHLLTPSDPPIHWTFILVLVLVLRVHEFRRKLMVLADGEYQSSYTSPRILDAVVIRLQPVGSLKMLVVHLLRTLLISLEAALCVAPWEETRVSRKLGDKCGPSCLIFNLVNTQQVLLETEWVKTIRHQVVERLIAAFLGAVECCLHHRRKRFVTLGKLDRLDR